MLDSSIASLLALAGHSPLLQAIAIIVGTFILEDAATVIAAMQAEAGGMSIAVALAALFIGIVLGDLGLYGLGRLAGFMPWIDRLLPPRRQDMMRGWLAGRVFRVVLVSRFLPGMRLPTYSTCGFLRADLKQFTLAAICATLCWTSLLFGVSLRVGQFLMDHFGAWRWAGAGGFAVFVILAGRVAVVAFGNARR
jgi:membrane protein DedA with SNARE-associated domain